MHEDWSGVAIPINARCATGIVDSLVRLRRKLSDFLGITYRPVDVSQRLNVSPKEADALPDETVQMVANHFRSTYALVSERFGISDLGSLGGQGSDGTIGGIVLDGSGTDGTGYNFILVPIE